MSTRPITSSPARITGGDPRECYARWCGESGAADGLLLVDFELDEYWLPGGGRRRLTGAYLRQGGELRVAVTDRVLQPDDRPVEVQFSDWVESMGLCAMSPD